MSAPTIEVDLDPIAFTKHTVQEGWGDGLPCVPPTPDLVAEYLAATTRDPQEIVAVLPPLGAECTVERIAINAAMTAAPPAAMELLCASISAMTAIDFNLASLNATTAPVTPSLVVNGSLRQELDIASGAGCLGGALGSSASIGRALRLIMRSVAGQKLGITSELVFGQPARVVGIVTGEWEERSPWAPLAERRGVAGDAVTVFGAMGTQNIVDTIAERATSLLELIGQSIAYIGSNAYCVPNNDEPGEIAIALNPIWAQDIIAPEIPSIEDVQQLIWEHAWQPIDVFPVDYREPLEDLGRVEDGRVRLVNSPEKLIVFVCGGLGALHATAFHGFGHNLASTVGVPAAVGAR